MERVRIADAGPNSWHRPSPSRCATVTSARPGVLVAVVEADQRNELADLLESAGCEPCTVADGREALRLARQGIFRLAIVDAHLPGLPGLRILEELRRHGDLPVIVTGPDHPETKRQAVSLGADRYLVRPIDPRQLLRAVSAVLAPRTG